MKFILKIAIIFGAIAWLLSSSVPRLMSDLWHARDYVPAQGYTATKYECTNVNGFMFNHCTVTFVSLQSRESREITDWRFGRAPSDPVQLLQRRDDASAVTTDVSIRTVWNRLLMALMLVLFGVVLALALVAQEFKDEDTPIGAPSEEPARQPTGRTSFGKRHA
jgi:hypothetical protein